MTAIRENIKRVLEERANAWETAGKPLADIASTREFSGEERTKFEAAERDFTAYSERLKALNLSLEQERAISEFSAQMASDPTVRSAFETELRSVVALRTSPAVDFEFTGKEMRRALAKVTPGAGGAVVPGTFWDQLMVPLRNFVSVLQAGATQITTASGEDITLPRLAGFGSAAQTAEAAALAGTDPTFDQLVLRAYKLGELIYTSRELVEDSAIDIEGLIADLIGQNIGILLGQRLTTGTGTNQTAGIVTAATVGVTGAAGAGGLPTFDNLIDLQYSVAAPYRVNASWVIADTALGSIRKLKDSTGAYLWEPTTQLDEPDRILGKPVFGDPNMAAPAAGATPIVFGDMSKYWVRFVNSLRVERSDQAAFATDQVAFRGILRADGILTDASAVKSFKGGAAA